MEIIRQWAVSICFAAVVCAIVMMIVPPGSTEKVFRITVSAFFICCAALPIISNFSDINLELNLSFEQNEDIASDIAEKMDEQIINEIEFQLSNSAKEIFNKYNCDATAEFSVIANDDRQVSVKEIKVYIPSDEVDKAKTIANEFLDTYGCSPEIIAKE